MGGGKASKPVESSQIAFDVLLQQVELPKTVNALLELSLREGKKGKKRETQTTLAQRVAMNRFQPRISLPGVSGVSTVKDNDGLPDGGN